MIQSVVYVHKVSNDADQSLSPSVVRSTFPAGVSMMSLGHDARRRMTHVSPRTYRLLLTCILLFQLGAVALVTRATLVALVGAHEGDWRIYERYATRFLNGDLPYVSFAMEYPPAAMIPLALPALVLPEGATSREYQASFFVFNVLWSVLMTLTVASTARVLRPDNPDRAALGAAAGCALLFAASALIFPFRYDVFPLLMSMLGIRCALTRRPVASGLWLGLGVASKIYPGVFIPMVMIWFWRAKSEGLRARSDGWRDALKVGVCGALPLAVCLVPYVLLETTAYLNFLRYHALRGLQIESVWAGVIMAGHRLGLTDASVVHNYGAQHVNGAWAGWMLKVQPVVSGIAILAVLIKAWRGMAPGRSDADRLNCFVNLSLAMLLAFMAFNKVFSTQFVVWPIGLVALASVTGNRRLPLLWFVVVLLTLHGFPYDYWGLVNMNPAPVVALNARNALVVMMLVILCAGRRAERNGEVGMTKPQ